MARPAPSLTQFRTAGEMFVRGETWRSIGQAVGRSGETVRRWPERYPHQWNGQCVIAFNDAQTVSGCQTMLATGDLLKKNILRPNEQVRLIGKSLNFHLHVERFRTRRAIQRSNVIMAAPEKARVVCPTIPSRSIGDPPARIAPRTDLGSLQAPPVQPPSRRTRSPFRGGRRLLMLVAVLLLGYVIGSLLRATAERRSTGREGPAAVESKIIQNGQNTAGQSASKTEVFREERTKSNLTAWAGAPEPYFAFFLGSGAGITGVSIFGEPTTGTAQSTGEPSATNKRS